MSNSANVKIAPYCGKCGKAIKRGNLYCTGCGARAEVEQDEPEKAKNDANLPNQSASSANQQPLSPTQSRIANSAVKNCNNDVVIRELKNQIEEYTSTGAIIDEVLKKHKQNLEQTGFSAKDGLRTQLVLFCHYLYASLNKMISDSDARLVGSVFDVNYLYARNLNDAIDRFGVRKNDFGNTIPAILAVLVFCDMASGNHRRCDEFIEAHKMFARIFTSLSCDGKFMYMVANSYIGMLERHINAELSEKKQNESLNRKGEHIQPRTTVKTSHDDYEFFYCAVWSEALQHGRVWVPVEKEKATGVIISKYKGNSDEARIPSHVNKVPVVVIGKEAFLGSNVSSVHIPEGVEEIDVFAFADCKNLVSITIPESVTQIGSFAFRDCRSLSDTAINQIYHAGYSNLGSINPDYELFDGQRIDEINREALGDIDTGVDYGYLDEDYDSI